MFTGLVEEIGTIQRIQSLHQGKIFHILAAKICQDLNIDDSVSVNGVCLTATDVFNDAFEATAVQETLDKSTLNSFQSGVKVNLERALRASDRLGGHWVQGHVDGIGSLMKILKKGTGYQLEFQVPDVLQKYCVEKGSITVNGISLTIASVSEGRISAAVIPHTYSNTILKYLKERDSLNIEVDILAKYIESILRSSASSSGRDEAWYRSRGF